MATTPFPPLANTTIVLIRHAEKPESGTGLSPAGEARASAYVDFFTNFRPIGMDVSDSFQINALFAAAHSAGSERPSLTLAPLAGALGLEIDTQFKDKQFGLLARFLRDSPNFANSGLVICWHHEKLLSLAEALGVDATALPRAAAWPARWPDDVFGWLLQVSYGGDGRVDESRTRCINQHLTRDDTIDP